MTRQIAVTPFSGHDRLDQHLRNPEFEQIIDRCIDDALSMFRTVFHICDGPPRARESHALRSALRVFLAKANKPQWAAPEVGPEVKREPPLLSPDGSARHCSKCKNWLVLGMYCKGMHCPLNPN